MMRSTLLAALLAAQTAQGVQVPLDTAAAVTPHGVRVEAGRYLGNQNVKNLFAKLEVLLALDAGGSSSPQAARDELRSSLKDLS